MQRIEDEIHFFRQHHRWNTKHAGHFVLEESIATPSSQFQIGQVAEIDPCLGAHISLEVSKHQIARQHGRIDVRELLEHHHRGIGAEINDRSSKLMPPPSGVKAADPIYSRAMCPALKAPP